MRDTSSFAEPDVSEFVITRHFDAPRALVFALVFKAWTEADHLRNWFGTKGFTTVSSKIDPRPGGAFLYGMRAPDGAVIWSKWTFREIVPPERLVVIISFCDEAGDVDRHPWSPSWPPAILSRLTFFEQGGRTVLTVRWGPFNPTEPECNTFEASQESLQQSWTGTLDQLAKCLAKTWAKLASYAVGQ